jgi:hypothetical protein
MSLRRYAISREVAGSTLDEVFDFFFSAPNPPSRTMTPGFTQSITEMSTGKFLGVRCF